MHLEEIREAIELDPAFSHMRSTHFINYVGGTGCVQNALIAVIGEAPGKFENFHCKPFVGQSGRLLREMLKLARISTDILYITNVVKYRPMDDYQRNRTPTREEIDAFIPYLKAELEAVGNPKIIIPVGRVAVKVFLPSYTGSLISACGEGFVGVEGKTYYPMLHPAYVLRNPESEAKYIQDWRNLAEWISTFHRQVP